MDYLRQLQAERPLLFGLLLLVGFVVAFQIAIFVIQLVVGPFGLPGWAPIVILVGGLVLIARRQNR
ncbi:hypothetical protein E9529_19420 [Blastococcus sp. KM273128]|uniref:hypothetical protein n=1 Tax=Blastococcus sp. KM273128 TaxID=2570314 RepID=UPI001F45F04E|nr:hypothetical protein [Blastococcus sp. KM273128]MCF6746401.1 hypothetical protein [Blastococcus sp. KM273128]